MSRLQMPEQERRDDYYIILGVARNADEQQIKTAYKRQAIRFHPDKARNDPSATDRFHEISTAYRVLSDPQLRREYDREGRIDQGCLNASQNSQTNRQFFQAIIGGDEGFRNWIGELRFSQKLASQLDSDSSSQNDSPVYYLQIRTKKVSSSQQSGQSTAVVPFEEMVTRRRVSRVEFLKAKLLKRIRTYEGNHESGLDRHGLKLSISEEATALSMESFGIDLLHLIGKMYVTQAEEFLDGNVLRNSWSGLSKPAAAAAEGLSLVAGARKLQATINTMLAAREASARQGGRGAEHLAELETRAMQELIGLTWQATQMEVQSVVREVCDSLLRDKSRPREERHVLAEGIRVIGRVFSKAQPSQESDAAKRYYFEHLAHEVSFPGSKPIPANIGRAGQSRVDSFEAQGSALVTTKMSDGSVIGKIGRSSEDTRPRGRIFNDSKPGGRPIIAAGKPTGGSEGYMK